MSAHFDPNPVVQFGAQWWYRHVCAVGGVFNILTMLAANLVGFVIGTDGISYMIGQLADSWEGTCDKYGEITHGTDFAKFNPPRRPPIRALYMFLSVRWRTDDV